MHDTIKLVPGLRGYGTSESYRGQSDHPFYMSYLREEHRKCVGVQTGEIMQQWVSIPIISEGYTSCYPLIAINNNKAQVIHMSRDPWRQTNTDEYWQRLKEWQGFGCDVTLFRVMRSAISRQEIEQMQKMFGSRFLDLDLSNLDSRFGLVLDVRERLLVVQLTDAKELRKYQV